LGQREYSLSGGIFESFLVNRPPFNREFTQQLAHTSKATKSQRLRKAGLEVGLECLLPQGRVSSGCQRSLKGSPVAYPFSTGYKEIPSVPRV
jgi:hypothetical protein